MNSAASPTLLVLAAGMGSAAGSKRHPAGPGGETIIDYYDALRAGFGSLASYVIRKSIEEEFRESVACASKSASRSTDQERSFHLGFERRPAELGHAHAILGGRPRHSRALCGDQCRTEPRAMARRPGI